MIEKATVLLFVSAVAFIFLLVSNVFLLTQADYFADELFAVERNKRIEVTFV